jgi:signal transduction histidine kinase
LKKLSFYLPLILLLLSCQKKKIPAAVDYTIDYRKAAAFIYHQNDSAFYYFNKVVNSVKDSLQVAMAYNQMGAIQSDAGDYFGSQESLLLSLKYLNLQAPGNRSCLASDYNELGISSANLQNYNAAVTYYYSSLQYADNSSLRAVVVNNLAYSYQQMHRYNNAIKLYVSALNSVKNQADKSRTTTNLAFAKWLRNRQYYAAPYLISALHDCQARADLWGENLNYDCLAEFYRNQKTDSAIFYSLKMYTVAQKLKSSGDQLITLKRLIMIGDPAAAKQYFSHYQQLTDSVQHARNNSKYQFALIRYNAEKAKADNLKLQKDNTEAKYQILWQRAFIGIIVISIIATIIALFFWYKKRKMEQQAATIAAVQEMQRNDSKKVHDTLANDVYYILKKVQNDDVPHKDWLVNHIDEVYERARDISRELTPETNENFHEYISERLKAFATDNTAVLLVGNNKELWNKINPVCRAELKNVLQELMVNMRKHSRAASVVVKFEDLGEMCRIFYSDDGVGIAENKIWGQGLNNTENRMKVIGGEITFDNKVNEGFQITITFPFI